MPTFDDRARGSKTGALTIDADVTPHILLVAIIASGGAMKDRIYNSAFERNNGELNRIKESLAEAETMDEVKEAVTEFIELMRDRLNEIQPEADL